MTKYFRLREGWLMLGLVALMLFSVVWSIQRAGWSDGLFILTPITLAGMLVGLLATRIRGVPRLLLHVTGMLAGVVIVLWETANLLDDPRLITLQDRVQDLLSRLGIWSHTIAGGGMSDDLWLFVLSLAVVTWLLAYCSTWFVFRSRWLWWALVPNGLALIVNISYSSAPLQPYFILFTLSALLLMVRFNMLLHEERWERERVNYSPTLRWTFLWVSTLVAVSIAALMWFMPGQAVNGTLSYAWNQVNGPWQDIQDRWSKAFAGVNGTGNFGFATFNDSWTLGGSLSLGDDVVLKAQVSGDHPLYWRLNTDDQYTGRGWNNTAQQTFHGRNISSHLSLDANQPLQNGDAMRVPVTATVQVVRPKSNLLFAPLRPASISQPTLLSVSWVELNKSFAVPGTDPQTVPIELQPLLSLLTDARRAALQAYGRDPAHPDDGGTQLPSGDPEEVAKGVLARIGQDATINAEVGKLSDRGITASYWLGKNFTFMVRANGPIPVYDDLTAVYSANHVEPNSQYTVDALVSNADKQTLRNAGQTYPTWVTARYLQLPSDLPVRVIEKAHEVVDQAGATNPYDEASALENFLRTYTYNTHISLAPSGRDVVDYFLFDSKEGYCEYYSTAMVVMLRALGIPAREAVGYAPGEFDADTHVWTVRESISHAWPEVYFPGAGWTQFEPTPSQSVINRPESQAAALASPTPFVDLTPRAVPTRPFNEDPASNPANHTTGSNLTGAGMGGAGALGWLLLFVVLGTGTWLFLRGWREQRGIATGRIVVGGIQYYQRMLNLVWWLGLRPRPHDTPFEFADRVSEEVPGARPYLQPITRAYVHERFGQHRPDQREQLELARVWPLLRNRLLRRLSEARRRVTRR